MLCENLDFFQFIWYFLDSIIAAELAHVHVRPAKPHVSVNVLLVCSNEFKSFCVLLKTYVCYDFSFYWGLAFPKFPVSRPPKLQKPLKLWSCMSHTKRVGVCMSVYMGTYMHNRLIGMGHAPLLK